MADLIAQGPEVGNRWRRTLPPGQSLVLGRQAGMFSVPWDDQISRQHVELRWDDGKLWVKKLDSGRNPIFVRGREGLSFELFPQDHFVIGSTRFLVADDAADLTMESPQPVEELAYDSQDLQRLRFRNADHRIEVLSRVPDVIAGAANEQELLTRLVNMLLAGIARAETAAVVKLDTTNDQGHVQILHWDRRLAIPGDFNPSERLIRESVQFRHQSVVHVWKATREASLPAFTLAENVDWAFCTPVSKKGGLGWGLYVSGRFANQLPLTPTPVDSTDLRDDIKFAELVAAIFNSLQEVRQLQRQFAGFSQFFSPAVLSALEAKDPETVLAPRLTEVAVLFCDLRGFSRESERSADDLLGLLNRVSRALGVTTQHILKQGGVVGDFQGDAVMGFWGWPIPQANAVELACKAALGIRAQFEEAAQQGSHTLRDFQMGIGIATGTAVAGRIGTTDQGKVTVFGPVVNLASRLEGMTKLLQAPILLDETAAAQVREQLAPHEGRLRRVAVVKPYGLDTPVAVSELLPPAAQYPQLTDSQIADYEAALAAFQQGQWSQAYELLHRVPPTDRVKDFLTIYIAQRNRTPPADFQGFIPLQTKS